MHWSVYVFAIVFIIGCVYNGLIAVDLIDYWKLIVGCTIGCPIFFRILYAVLRIEWISDGSYLILFGILGFFIGYILAIIIKHVCELYESITFNPDPWIYSAVSGIITPIVVRILYIISDDPSQPWEKPFWLVFGFVGVILGLIIEAISRLFKE